VSDEQLRENEYATFSNFSILYHQDPFKCLSQGHCDALPHGELSQGLAYLKR